VSEYKKGSCVNMLGIADMLDEGSAYIHHEEVGGAMETEQDEMDIAYSNEQLKLKNKAAKLKRKQQQAEHVLGVGDEETPSSASKSGERKSKKARIIHEVSPDEQENGSAENEEESNSDDDVGDGDTVHWNSGEEEEEEETIQGEGTETNAVSGILNEDVHATVIQTEDVLEDSGNGSTIQEDTFEQSQLDAIFHKTISIAKSERTVRLELAVNSIEKDDDILGNLD
jgi:hypothetical protein